MLKDITIGQYFPGNSPIHRLDPRTKILLTFVYIILLFVVSNPYGYALSILFTLLLYVIAKIPIKMILKSLKPIIPIILFTAILNMFFVSGDPVFQLGFVSITKQGIKLALVMAIRILCLIAGTSILTYTTLPIALTDGIEHLLKPLKKVKFPVHELAMMMTIALRFIPTLIEETDKIMAAQKARGADMETGSILQRAKALIPILIPLFISAFRRAEELAMAMEARCYRGGEGRTRLKQLKFHGVDFGAWVVLLLLFAAVILLNLFVPAPF